VASRFGEFGLDTVIALNVIEHIEEDVAAMRSMRDMLVPGGRAIVLVPALPRLYGSLDRELGHARRYTRNALATHMKEAGLRMSTSSTSTSSALWLVRERTHPPRATHSAQSASRVRCDGAGAAPGGRDPVAFGQSSSRRVRDA